MTSILNMLAEATSSSLTNGEVAIANPNPASDSWLDKYRPHRVEDLLHSEKLLEQLKGISETPNSGVPLLIAGDPGTGKTTTAEVLIAVMGLERHKINGALNRGIDAVRDLQRVMDHHPFFGDRHGILVDEIDGFTPEAFSGLRGDTLESSRVTSTIFATCNDLKKISKPVRDRFKVIDLDAEIEENRQELLDLHLRRAVAILTAENIPHDELEVDRIVKATFPSVRSLVTELQSRAALGAIRSKSALPVVEELPSEATPPVVHEDEIGVIESPPIAPTDLSLLLDDMVAYLGRYIATGDENLMAMALWALHVFVHDAAPNSALLWLSSPVKRCGKTTALKAVSRLVPKPIITSNISVAGMLDLIESDKPTFLIDEMEHALKATSQLHGILNLGHAKDGFMIRKGMRRSTWAPKVIALIGELPDTLADRSIRIALRRRLPTEQVERFKSSDAAEAADLQARCRAWATDLVLKALEDADPPIPTELSDRAQDNWRPLIAIADTAGGAWPEKARKAAVAVSGQQEIEMPSPSILILQAARDLLAAKESSPNVVVTHISSRELAEEAAAVGASNGPIEGRMIRIARILAGLGVHRTTYRDGGKTAKGFPREALMDAFKRFLTGEDA